MTPKTVNSLAEIAGHEGDEEPWNVLYDADEVPYSPPSLPTSIKQLTVIQPASQESAGSQLQSPHLASTSPPPGANVRRHQSLTAAAGATRKLNSGLRRSGTLQVPMPSHHSHTPTETQQPEEEYPLETIEQDEYCDQNQNHPTNSVGHQSPWGASSNSNQNNEWRGFSQVAVDDVERALSAFEIARTTGAQTTVQYYNPYSGAGAGTGQSLHPPRFNPKHPPPLQPPGAPRLQQNTGNNEAQFMSEFEGRTTPLATGPPRNGSANTYYQNSKRSGQSDERTWEGRERVLNARGSNPNLHHGYHNKNTSSSSAGSGNGSNSNETIPDVPPIPPQYIQQQPQRVNNNQNSNQTVLDAQQLLNASIDVPTLVATKGYNPPTFDHKPAFARFFVIKSYTEDDVHKSLKYEIWSSTDPGNKRLDKAFKETAGRGPIYLFFSVNAR